MKIKGKVTVLHIVSHNRAARMVGEHTDESIYSFKKMFSLADFIKFFILYISFHISTLHITAVFTDVTIIMALAYNHTNHKDLHRVYRL